ncbi:hypothetical protein GCM10027063_07440 [Promicromonospora xylanilytica]
MTEISAARRRWPAWAVPFGAAVAAVAVWLIGAALGANLEARLGAEVQAVSVVAMAVAALAAGFAGWGVRVLIARLVRGGGELVWFVLCGVVLLASMLGAIAGTTPGAVVTLVVAHAVVGVVIALGLRRTGQRVTAASIPV